MSLISDSFYKRKLEDYKINIKTKYIVGNKIYERNADDSVNDDIKSGIIYEKDYYVRNSLVHKENIFDSRIEYTFISKEMENKEYTCPNCGLESKIKTFTDGCPYCRTHYNIDYTDKDLGSKYHYDRVLKSNLYKVITAIFTFAISILLAYIFIKNTSRTFNIVDKSKILIYGLILSMILYYFFYILDAYILLWPIKIYKDRKNQKQIDFWNKTKIDKKTFFNNLNYEMRKYYYSKRDIIDFDILDYIEFSDFVKNGKEYVKVFIDIRIVYFNNGKIKSKSKKEEFILRKNSKSKLILKDGANIIKCPNCGASVDATKEFCSYCNTEFDSLQEWILVK